MSRPALNYDELPDDPMARSETLEIRSRPDPKKPSLPAEVEARLAAIEERHAQCYTEAEEITFRLHRAARRINEGVVPRSPRPDTSPLEAAWPREPKPA